MLWWLKVLYFHYSVCYTTLSHTPRCSQNLELSAAATKGFWSKYYLHNLKCHHYSVLLYKVPDWLLMFKPCCQDRQIMEVFIPLSKIFRSFPHHLTVSQRHLGILWSVSWCPPSPGQESNQTVSFVHSSQVRCCPVLEVRREVDSVRGRKERQCRKFRLCAANIPISKTCLHYHLVHIKSFAQSLFTNLNEEV